MMATTMILVKCNFCIFNMSFSGLKVLKKVSRLHRKQWPRPRPPRLPYMALPYMALPYMPMTKFGQKRDFMSK